MDCPSQLYPQKSNSLQLDSILGIFALNQFVLDYYITNHELPDIFGVLKLDRQDVRQWRPSVGHKQPSARQVHRPGTPKFHFNNMAKYKDFLFRLSSYEFSPIKKAMVTIFQFGTQVRFISLYAVFKTA